MFLNNGPVPAHNAIRAYIAGVGLNGFAEEHRPAFEALLSMRLFEALTAGVERLYAAVRELPDLPDRPAAIMALGEAAQASAIAGFEGQKDRRWAIQAWAISEFAEPGVDDPLAPPPEVLATASFHAEPVPPLLGE
jgi:hypothetical protein